MTDRNCTIPGCLALQHGHQLCAKHCHRLRKYGDPLGGPTFDGEPLAFYNQELWILTDECKIWPYARDLKGYGHLAIDGKTVKVHVLACIAYHGDRPSPLMVASHGPCHDTRCWNGAHQSWQTKSENGMDKLRDGSLRFGERVPTSKLTETDVLEIRQAHHLGEQQVVLARKYGVSKATICNIVARKVWRHTPDAQTGLID